MENSPDLKSGESDIGESEKVSITMGLQEILGSTLSEEDLAL